VYWRRSLTRLELALYAALIGVAIALFADRLLDTMEIAEATAVDVTLSRINSAINVQLAADRFIGRLPAIAEAMQRNPFEVARMSPGNFLGELEEPDLELLDRGNWLFDRTRKELVYLPRLRRGLQAPESVLRFRLERRGADAYVLVPVRPYSWRPGM
jgi:hypothetical protein